MLRIKIHDWRQYVTRTDLKSIPWVRVTSTIGSDRILHGSVTSTRWLFIYLVCEAARQNEKGALDVTLEYVRDFSSCTEDEIFAGLKFLESRKILSCRYEPVTDPLRIRDVSGTNPIESVSNVTEGNGTEGNGKKERVRGRGCASAPDAADGGSLSLANSGSRKSKIKPAQVMDLSDAELDLGTQWLKLAVTHFPNRVTDPKWTPHLFALELRKVANVCSYTIADMQKILDHIKHDTFWSPKAACPSGLLKKGSNGLRKIENIFAQTKSKAQIKDAMTAQEWADNPEKAADWQEMLEWIGGKKP